MSSLPSNIQHSICASGKENKTVISWAQYCPHQCPVDTTVQIFTLPQPNIELCPILLNNLLLFTILIPIMEWRRGWWVNCSDPVPVPAKSNLNWDLHYNHCKAPTLPSHPGKYVWATSRLLRKLTFDIEAFFNQTSPASPQLVSQKCRG